MAGRPPSYIPTVIKRRCQTCLGGWEEQQIGESNYLCSQLSKPDFTIHDRTCKNWLIVLFQKTDWLKGQRMHQSVPFKIKKCIKKIMGGRGNPSLYPTPIFLAPGFATAHAVLHVLEESCSSMCSAPNGGSRTLEQVGPAAGHKAVQ